MMAFLHRLAVVRGVLLLVSSAAVWAQTKSVFPAEEPAPLDPLPSCNVAVLGDCLMPGPRPMSWEAAHRHCRSAGGFLLEREELGQFDHLWTSRYQTPLQKNLTMPVSVLSWPALNSSWPGGEASLEDLTLTGLTFHGRGTLNQVGLSARSLKKGLERTGREIQLYKRGEGYICIDNEEMLSGSNLLRCFANGREIKVKKAGKEENEQKVLQLFDLLGSTSELTSGCVIRSVRSTTKCFSETTVDSGIEERNLTWPSTAGGIIALPKELCITEEGEPVTRECLGSFLTGYYWGSPSSSCMGEPTNKTKQLWEINNNATVEKADIPTTLSSITQNGSTLQPVDIHFVATSFKTLSEETEKLDELDLEEIVQTINNVMEAKDETFEPVQKKLLSSSILYEAFEEMTFKVQLPEAKGDQKVNASRKLITVERFDLEMNSTIIGFESRKGGTVETTIEKGFRTDHADTDVAIILPENLTYTVATSHVSMRANIRFESKIQLAFAVFKNAKLFQDRDSFPNYTVSSPIIQATYRGEVVKNLEEPVTLIFKPPEYGRRNTKCVFWDFSKNGGRGGWSTQGCWKGKSRGNHDVCHCNHLTCFAQLMNYNSDDFDGNHALALDIITIIGCCLSIGGLLLVFTTFFLFKKWRRPLDNKILVNLSFSVFCSIVIFLAGINQTWNKILCRSIAVALHYFILASFGWMLVEAVHQYLKFVKVVGTYIPRFMWKASVSAWGVPVVPIIVVLVCDSSLYDNGDDSHPESNICWMSRDGFLYAFLPPLVLTMVINIIMFSLILYGAVCGRARVNSTMSERSLFISQLRMAICVFVLLGFTQERQEALGRLPLCHKQEPVVDGAFELQQRPRFYAVSRSLRQRDLQPRRRDPRHPSEADSTNDHQGNEHQIAGHDVDPPSLENKLHPVEMCSSTHYLPFLSSPFAVLSPPPPSLSLSSAFPLRFYGKDLSIICKSIHTK
ncbi:lipoprotein receptor [Penaeus vannamei]|uniref:Lipoprotein receptor n=1 Tax=Penaeus vannamei TaxID=6689 RepID=A0A423U5Y0_PENVA|nr:lipoprotein receptor [Penaeus vannamei]